MPQKTANRSQAPVTSDSVRQYLCEIGRYPLLTAEQEVQLATQVSQAVRLQEVCEQLTEALGREPRPEEWAKAAGIERERISFTLRSGERAKRKMVESNLRLVVSIAKKYQHRGLDFLVLIQEGSVGLQRAAEKFEVEKGYKFSTYAYWWIRQAITRAIANDARPIRYPIHVTEKINRLKKASRILSERLNRTPRLSELAVEMKINPEEVSRLIQLSKKTISLSARVGKDKDSELIELIPDETSEVEVLESRETVDSLLSNLTPREREVIRWRFGLDGASTRSLAEIGQKYELSRERIRQIENKAMRKLKGFAQRKHIKLEEVL